MTLTSVLAAATVVIAGAGVSLLTGQPARPEFGWICIFIATGFLCAMTLTIAAAAPTEFEFSGNSPAGWEQDVENGKTLEQSLAEQCEHYAGIIEKNNRSTERSNIFIRDALIAAWGSLLVGGIFGFAALFDRYS